jgi:hypothetical protein
MKTQVKRYPDTKKIFWKLGACSSTLYHIVSREIGQVHDADVRAAAPLAGGIMLRGRQCGMLWGAVLAAGAEAYRRVPERDRAVALAVAASRSLVGSFTARTGTVSCREFTGCNWRNPFGIAKYMLTGGVPKCFNLADRWAPEAAAVAAEALAGEKAAAAAPGASCASEVARMMNAGDEEAVTVAGLAGGIGLSGDGCGALAAAIWLRSLAWCREHPEKKGSLSNPPAKIVLKAFFGETGGEMLCNKICGRHFETPGEHTEFVKNDGCGKLLRALAQA